MSSSSSNSNIFNVDDLDSCDISTVLNCLNLITKASYDAPNRITMQLLSLVLMSFGELLDTLNPFFIKLDIPSQSSLSVSTLIARKQRFSSWEVPSKYFEPYALQALHYSVEDNVLILMILNILRNYSTEVYYKK
jgi:hypothetical protein